MIVPLILAGGAFYLGGRYKFAKRNCPRPRAAGPVLPPALPLTPAQAAALPGHLYFQGRR